MAKFVCLKLRLKPNSRPPQFDATTTALTRCSVEGETMSINQWLVRQGVAIDFETFAHGRYQSDENDARQNRRGLWSGCFVAPQHLRYWRKPVAPLLGSACSNEPNARDKLFPDNPEMPPGCSIKGKFAVRA